MRPRGSRGYDLFSLLRPTAWDPHRTPPGPCQGPRGRRVVAAVHPQVAGSRSSPVKLLGRCPWRPCRVYLAWHPVVRRLPSGGPLGGHPRGREELPRVG